METYLKPPVLGVRPDLDPENVDDKSLVAGENVINRDGDFRTRPGFTSFADNVHEVPMAYIQYDHADGNPRTVLGTQRSWRRLTGNVWTDISGGVPLNGGFTEHIVFRTFSKANATWLLGVNGADNMKKWDGTSPAYADVGGSPPRARCMCVVFDRIVLGNLLTGGTISPVAIDVSANKDFDAGWGSQLVALLADTEGPIISMEEMGTLNAAILKSDSVYMLIAQGGTDPFRIQWVKSGISGPASARLSCKLWNGGVAITGRDGLVSTFDGANVAPLPYAIQRQIVRTANLEKLNRGWMLPDSDRRELWIVYPLIGSDFPNGGMVINMTTLACYPIRFPAHHMMAGGKITTTAGITIGQLVGPIGSLSNTIGSFASTAVIRRLVLGNSLGQTLQEIGNTDDGAPIPFYWDTPIRGQTNQFHTIDSIRHRFKYTVNTQPVDVLVGSRDEGDAINFVSQTSIDLHNDSDKVTSHRFDAEYFGLRYQGNATEPVIYQGAMVDVKQRGKR